MKKLLISILICALTISLCACGIKTTTITYPDGQKEVFSDQFTLIKTVSGDMFDNACHYLYDNATKIIYLYTCGDSHATMCPYYILVNNEPTIAVYGENYTLGE